MSKRPSHEKAAESATAEPAKPSRAEPTPEAVTPNPSEDMLLLTARQSDDFWSSVEAFRERTNHTITALAKKTGLSDKWLRDRIKTPPKPGEKFISYDPEKIEGVLSAVGFADTGQSMHERIRDFIKRESEIMEQGSDEPEAYAAASGNSVSAAQRQSLIPERLYLELARNISEYIEIHASEHLLTKWRGLEGVPKTQDVYELMADLFTFKHKQEGHRMTSLTLHDMTHCEGTEEDIAFRNAHRVAGNIKIDCPPETLLAFMQMVSKEAHHRFRTADNQSDFAEKLTEMTDILSQRNEQFRANSRA